MNGRRGTASHTSCARENRTATAHRLCTRPTGSNRQNRTGGAHLLCFTCARALPPTRPTQGAGNAGKVRAVASARTAFAALRRRRRDARNQRARVQRLDGQPPALPVSQLRAGRPMFARSPNRLDEQLRRAPGRAGLSTRGKPCTQLFAGEGERNRTVAQSATVLPERNGPQRLSKPQVYRERSAFGNANW